MDGYHNLPEQTAETLTEDGWLQTGDIGELDADGYLKITDRKKDLFKTSGGKYIAPSSIESQFKAVCPYASQFLVHGAERNFCVALITLDPDAMEGWAAENGMAGKSYAEIVGSQQVQDMVGGYVETLNARLNRWETIKKWILLDHDLTVESGELTPSMKVKRKVVEEQLQGQDRRALRLIRSAAPSTTGSGGGPAQCCRRRWEDGAMPSVLPEGEPAPEDGSLPASALTRARHPAVRVLRARAVLRGALRLLRLQHLHRRASSAARAPRARRTPTRRSPRSGWRAGCSATSTCRSPRCSSAGVRRRCCRRTT